MYNIHIGISQYRIQLFSRQIILHVIFKSIIKINTIHINGIKRHIMIHVCNKDSSTLLLIAKYWHRIAVDRAKSGGGANFARLQIIIFYFCTDFIISIIVRFGYKI